MSTVDFEVLKLIPKMMEEMQDLKEVSMNTLIKIVAESFKIVSGNCQ